MHGVPFIPETAPFSVEQRAWLNGFLAGLFGSMPTAGVAPVSGGPLRSQDGAKWTLLYGSQSGTAEGLAKRIRKQAEERGMEVSLHSLDAYSHDRLAEGGTILVVTSTWGNCDPPDNAVRFWDWLFGAGAPRLESLQFGVLGLGDRNYPEFCGAAKKIETVTVSGKHCETDRLFPDIEMPETVKSGDYLQVLCTGAYNSSMANNYNRYQRPATAMLRSSGQIQLVQRPETWDEMFAREILPEDL